MIRLAKHIFTVAEYDRMAEAGVFAADARVELIKGEVVAMSPIGREHAACVAMLNKIFLRLLGDSTVIWIQNPIILGDYSEPQPDVAVLKPSGANYFDGKPFAEDVLLLVEVSDSTLESDQQIKVPLYAKAGIPEVWIVNLPEQTIEIYTQPRDGKYNQRAVVRRGEMLCAKTIPDVNLKSEDILG